MNPGSVVNGAMINGFQQIHTGGDELAGYMATSKTDDWASPREMVEAWSKTHGPFTFDPCASETNATALEYLTEQDNGLMHPWKGKIWFNPPYGRVLSHWMEKANLELDSGRVELIVALLPARTDTRWFHNHVLARRHTVQFIKGRVKYGNGKSPAPFPSIIVIMRPGGSE